MQHRWGSVALAGLVLVAIGCGGAAAEGVTPRSLAEPWQAVPFALPPETAQAAEATCRGGDNGMPAALPLVIVDARGGGGLLLVFGGPDGGAECILTVRANGTFRVDGSGGGGGPIDRAVGPGDVVSFSSGSMTMLGEPGVPATTRSYVIGRFGPGVVSVDVQTGLGRHLRASTSPQGWWAAWWPSDDIFNRAQGFDAAGVPGGVTQ